MDSLRIYERLEKSGIKYVTEATDQNLVDTAAVAEAGISGVDYAIGDTGTLVLLSGKGQARSISLLPPVHIAIVRTEQVVSDLAEFFSRLKADGRASNLSSAITFITGPSRTADIELTLVVGVHGPQQLHAIIVGD